MKHSFKILFSPNFLANTFNFTKVLDFEKDRVSVEDIVLKCLDEGFLNNSIQYSLFVNGQETDDTELEIKSHDEVIFKIRPQGKKFKNILRFILPIVLGTVFSGAFAKGLFGQKLGALKGFKLGVANLLGTFAAAIVTNKLVPPPQQDIGGRGGNQSKDTPLYTLTATQNQINPYGPIPVVYGRIRMYPPYAAKPYTEINGKDQYIYGVLGIGYVPADDSRIVVEDIKIGDTSIGNFQGVSINANTSVQRMDAASRSKYNADVHEEPLEIVLRQADSWVTRTTEEDTDILSFDLVAPSGLIRYDLQGNSFPVTVKFEAQIKEVSSLEWKEAELKRLTEVFAGSYIDTSEIALNLGSYIQVTTTGKLYEDEEEPLSLLANVSVFDRIEYMNYGFRSCYDINSGKLLVGSNQGSNGLKVPFGAILNIPTTSTHFTKSAYVRSLNLKNLNSTSIPQVNFVGSFLDQNVTNLTDPIPVICTHYCYHPTNGQMYFVVSRTVDRVAWVYKVNTTTGVIEVVNSGAVAPFISSAKPYEYSTTDFGSFTPNPPLNFASPWEAPGQAVAFGGDYAMSVTSNILLDTSAWQSHNLTVTFYKGLLGGIFENPSTNYSNITQISGAGNPKTAAIIGGNIVDNHSAVIVSSTPTTNKVNALIFWLRGGTTTVLPIIGPTFQALALTFSGDSIATGTVISDYSDPGIRPFPVSRSVRCFVHPIMQPTVTVGLKEIYCQKILLTCSDTDVDSPEYGKTKIYEFDTLAQTYSYLGYGPNGVQFRKLYNVGVHATEKFLAFIPSKAQYYGGGAITNPRHAVWSSSVINFDEDEKDALTYNLSGKSSQPVRWSFYVDPPGAGQYDVRLRRVSPDSGDDKIRDEIGWTTLRSFSNREAILTPNIKTVAFRLKATEQLSGSVSSLNLMASSVLRVWTGSEFVYQESNNPAWILADILTSGATKKPTQDSLINWTALKDWADFCDEKGFTCNVVVDNYTTQLQLLQDVAATGRASYDIIDGFHTVVVDKERTIPVQMFTPRNSWGFSAERTFVQKPHGLRIGFRNEDKDFDRDERIVYNDGYNSSNASFFETLDLWGVTNPDQVYKLGRYYLAIAQLRPEVLRFSTDLEMVAVTKGDLFLYQDDVIKWGIGSTRILAKATDSGNDLIIFEGTFDLDITEDYACRVKGEDLIIYSFTVTPYTYEAGVGNIRTTSAVRIVTGSGYSSIQAGNLIALGTVSPGAAIECIVTEVIPNADLGAEITAIEYAPAVFNADSEEIPAFDSKITETLTARRGEPVIPEVVEVVSDETALYINEAGSLVPGIRVRFAPVPRNTPNAPYGVRAAWRDVEDDSGQWNYVSFELDSEFQILLTDVTEGQYYWGSFQYVTNDGRVGGYTESENLFNVGFYKTNPHKVVGKSNPPSDITGLTSFFRNYAIALTWDKSLDRDIDYYEIRLKNNEGWAAQSQVIDSFDPENIYNNERSYYPSAIDLSEDGNTLIVGDPTFSNAVRSSFLSSGYFSGSFGIGKVHIYTKYSQGPNTRWRKVTELLPPDADMVDFLGFGHSVSINGDGTRIVISVRGSLYTGGPQYVYTYDLIDEVWTLRGGDHWSVGDKVTSVALSSDGLALAIGRWQESSNAGAVDLYNDDGTDWILVEGDIVPTFPVVTGGKFGHSVSLNSDGSVLAVGAPEMEVSSVIRGAVFTFDWDGTTLTQRNSLVSTNTDAGNNFGKFIDLSSDGTVLAVAATNEVSLDSIITGVVRVYENDGGTWELIPESVIVDPFTAYAGTRKFGEGGICLDQEGDYLVAATSFRQMTDDAIQFFTYGNWENGTLVTQDKTTTFVDNTRTTGSFIYMIKGVDTSGNESINHSEVTVTVLTPNAPTIDHTFDNLGNAILEWTVTQTTFFVDQFEIRVGNTGDTWDTADFLLTTKARKYSERVNYGGTRRYFFKTIDIAGNYSADTSYEDVTITNPLAVSDLSAQAIRSQVVLTWSSTPGSLPIRFYNVYKGTSVGSGTRLAAVDATIAQITETEPSNPVYRYWVTSVDTAGNESDGTMVEVAVSPQSDYTFIGSVLSDMRYPDSKSNYFITVLESGLKVGFPMIDGDQTFEDHFLSRAFTSPQDQIDEGSTYYLEPTDLDSEYIETLDMLNGNPDTTANIVNGTVVLDNSPSGYERTTIHNGMQELVTLRAGRITASANIMASGYSYENSADQKVTRVLKSSFSTVPDIGDIISGLTFEGEKICRVIEVDSTHVYYTRYSNDYIWATGISSGGTLDPIQRHTITWTTIANQQYNIFATDFRFVQVEYNWVNPPNTGDNLTYYRGLALGTSAEPLDDGGSAPILSTDVGGTFISYNQDFLQVTSVTGNALSTSEPYFLTFDFDSSELNPTGFYVYGWNTSGVRVSIDIAWRARGV